MKTLFSTMAVWALTFGTGYGQAPAGKPAGDAAKRGGTETKLPSYVGDETRLVQIKADPTKYVGKSFIICGGIKLDDCYNRWYVNAQATHYLQRPVLRETDSGGFGSN
ncbi:MAG: hypothetical protein ABSG86_04230 [Thermoguttaceae bacterium]|jgi:hypothetical protein